MTVDEFLGLRPTEDPSAWQLVVTEGLTSSSGAFFGGCALAAGIVTMEHVTQRPCVWAAAQYISYARVDSILDVRVDASSRGNTVTQAAADVRCGDTHMARVQAALGQRAIDLAGRWVEPPVVPPPLECPRRTITDDIRGAVHERVELRLARAVQFADLDGTPGDGHSALWGRLPGSDGPSAGGLAVLGDFLAMGVAQAIGVATRGTSLDNTLRVVALVPTEWVLLDSHVDVLTNGFAHGRINLWSEDGTLLAIASQTVAVRRR